MYPPKPQLAAARRVYSKGQYTVIPVPVGSVRKSNLTAWVHHYIDAYGENKILPNLIL